MKKVLFLYLALIANINYCLALVYYPGPDYTAYVSYEWYYTSMPAHINYNGLVNASIDQTYRQNHENFDRTVTGIGDDAFHDCPTLRTVKMPSTIKYIGANAFYKCEKLDSIPLSKNITHIGYKAFNCCYNLARMEIPNGVTSIADEAFMASGLKYLYIPNTIVEIGEHVFSACNDLMSVTFEEGLTTIGVANFQYAAFAMISLPSSITNIGNAAFYGCSNIVAVYNHSTTPQTIDQYCFGEVDVANCTLFVPQESITSYSQAVGWRDFGHIRAIGSAHVVQFVDWDGSLISAQVVNDGEDAVTPATPMSNRTGYIFKEWDSDFTNVQADLTITAQYTKVYKVTFINWDQSELLKLENLEEGTLPEYTGETPTRPEDNKYRYEFIYWSPDIVPVHEDATYRATFRVIDKSEGIDDIEVQQQTTKKISDGLLFIESNGKVYNAQGIEIK